MTLRVFLTGASSGIGHEIALRYSESGAIVGAASRSEASGYRADVRDAASIRQAAEAFISAHGCPDIVYANAGISAGNLNRYEEDLDTFRDIFDTNVIGMANTFQPFLPHMLDRGSGTLVGIASVAGFRGLPGASAYSASKAAVIAYLEGLRAEVYRSGIRVVTISPGYIETPMTEANPYPMPFLVPAPKAAKLIVKAVESGKLSYTFPWPMKWVGSVLKLLPDGLHARLFSGAPHKPRRIR